MKSSYRSIKEYAFGEHEKAFSVLLEVLNQCSLSFFLIGAQARDVHFFQQGIKPSRGTRDIDFAVMVDSMDHFDELTDVLMQRGFEETRDPYRFNGIKETR